METTYTTYTTIGNVRGDCGHQHKTRETAEACLLRDRKGCQKQGGYSDRYIMETTVPEWRLHKLGK